MKTKQPGPDITEQLDNIHLPQEMKDLFKSCMDKENLAKLSTISHKGVLKKIASAIKICHPKNVFVNTGSPDDKAFVRNLALEKGEEAPLAMENHTIHYDLKDEQGRIVDRTYYISDPWEYVSSLAKRMDRDKAYKEILNAMTGIMDDKTMVIGFYMRGPAGAQASNPAMEITSSAYVSHSADLLYRNSFDLFEKEVERLGYFFTNIHSEGLNRAQDLPRARVFMDRRYQTTYSYNCTYAGNTLLLKKGNHRFAVDRAVYENRGWELSEHMFITGINGPGGRVTWCAGAAPSGCGKTTTAMAGDRFIGDDLAQMWIEKDGSIRSINPECGIFGIVEDVNQEGDPILMEKLRKPGTEVIWTNVLVDDKRVPHWVGNGEPHPDKGFNFQGEWFKGKKDDQGKEIPLSHPNARCTLSSSALENYADAAEDPAGAITRIFTYSGRDSNTMPPVWVAKTPEEGVTIGACIVSAATATEVGATGIKRAPWANAPFIPGALGDYMTAQFKFFGNPAIAPEYHPVMAGLNYFLRDDARGGNSKKLLGEKRDVKAWLAWLERYAHDEVTFIKTPIGHLPRYPELKELFKTIINKEYPQELYVKQFSLYVDNIIERIDMQHKAYMEEAKIPETFFEILKRQGSELLAIKEKFGPVVTPAELETMV